MMDKTGCMQVSAGPDFVKVPELKVAVDGVTLVSAWVAGSGNLIVIESAYSLERGHEVRIRPAGWLAELMGWHLPAQTEADAHGCAA